MLFNSICKSHIQIIFAKSLWGSKIKEKIFRQKPSFVENLGLKLLVKDIRSWYLMKKKETGKILPEKVENFLFEYLCGVWFHIHTRLMNEWMFKKLRILVCEVKFPIWRKGVSLKYLIYIRYTWDVNDKCGWKKKKY